MNLHKNQDKETLEPVLLLRAIQNIISGKMPYDVKETMFSDNVFTEPDIEASPGIVNLMDENGGNPEALNNVANPVKDTLLRRINFGSLWKNANMRRILLKENQPKAGSIMLDLILGIGRGEVDVIPIVMRILGESIENFDIMKSMIHIFTGNSSMLYKASEKLEAFIAQTDIPITPGLIQSVIGAVRKQHNMMAKGINRAAISFNYKKDLKENYSPNTSDILLALVQSKLDDIWADMLPHIKKFLEKLTNVEMPNKSKPGKMFLIYAMGELEQFIGHAQYEFNLPQEGLKELYTLSVPKNPLNLKDFA